MQENIMLAVSPYMRISLSHLVQAEGQNDPVFLFLQFAKELWGWVRHHWAIDLIHVEEYTEYEIVENWKQSFISFFPHTFQGQLDPSLC